MANAAYRKLPDNSSYIQQVGNAGGPVAFRIGAEPIPSPNYFVYATMDFNTWWPNTNPTPYATAALAQQALDTYITSLNAGTA